MDTVIIRFLTIVLGAIPATSLGLLAIFVGMVSEGGDSLRLLLLAPIGAIGAVSLWKAGFGELPVTPLTAAGLACTVIASVFYAFATVQVDMMIIFALGPVIWLLNTWFQAGPPLIALAHILGSIVGRSGN